MRRTRYIAQAGLIAAVYSVLTFLTLQYGQSLAYGPVQFRLSEAVTILGLFTPAAIPGLWVGSMIANASGFGPLGALAWLDVVFGSLGTLLGAWWMWRFRKRTIVALLGPVLANALIVPAYLPILLKGFGLYEIPLLDVDVEGNYLLMYLFGVGFVGLGQAVVVYGLGLPLATALRNVPFIRDLAAQEQ